MQKKSLKNIKYLKRYKQFKIETKNRKQIKQKTNKKKSKVTFRGVSFSCRKLFHPRSYAKVTAILPRHGGFFFSKKFKIHLC